MFTSSSFIKGYLINFTSPLSQQKCSCNAKLRVKEHVGTFNLDRSTRTKGGYRSRKKGYGSLKV